MNRYERLQGLRVTVPCDQAWDAMEGDERTRHCERCDHCVHNLAEMTKRDAERLVSSGKRPCVRITRDRRGRIVYKAVGIGALWAAAMTWMVFTTNKVRGEDPGAVAPGGFPFFQSAQPEVLTGKLPAPDEPK
jgi:hypothetical protein